MGSMHENVQKRERERERERERNSRRQAQMDLISRFLVYLYIRPLRHTFWAANKAIESSACFSSEYV